MPAIFQRRTFTRRIGFCLALVVFSLAARGADWALTNLAQLRSDNPPVGTNGYQIELQGTVWWANPAVNELVLHDDSGTEKLELNLQGQPVRAGQRVRLEGYGTIARTGNGFRLGVIGPVVDNNGIHAMNEKFGTIFLSAGRQPLQLDWFNGINQFGLAAEWQGPDFSCQPISSDALFLTATGEVRGLKFWAYDVPGEVLPDFAKMTATQSGTVSNFDLGILPHTEHVGARFSGFLAVPQDGFYTFHVRSDDGCLLFVGRPTLAVKRIGDGSFPQPQRIAPGQALAESESYQWAEVEGIVSFAAEIASGMELVLSSDTGRLHLEVTDRNGLLPARLLGQRIRAVGVCESALSADAHRLADTLLVADATQIKLIETAVAVPNGIASTNHLPVLTTAVEVHQLKREEAQRGYPVSLRGVVTSLLPERQAFTLEDSTRGIYIEDHSASRAFEPQIGEFLEVTGTTDPSLFAPIVNAQSVRSLGAGHLPAPVRPTWDQLLNGSLDAQYVELQGIITSVTATNVTLLTREGRINLELRLIGSKATDLARYEGALVRVRGCLFANWDYVTHEVRAGDIRIYGATISVDQPAPEDLFALPEKTVVDLLRFDPEASVFQRVKVRGQIVHGHNEEFFLTDGRNALRFITRKPETLEAGDTVEVVGFPDLSGASPLLREAVVRKTGHAKLPAAQPLPVEKLTRADFDATLVRVKGVLVGIRESPGERVFEIQSGVRRFAARLIVTNGPVNPPPVGSLLELTGVYAALGANRATGQNVSTFELLLNSPEDIRVLARPPWWTLERLLIIVSALVCVLAVTLLWIKQLHRKVEQRTAELATQIQNRQRVEQQHAMEQERARVAQDLHDELGSSLTEISMLGARARSPAATDEKRKLYLEQMSGKARDMVTALDEIVWAMNPRHDSVASLVSYFCLYADRFLGLAGIAWRLEGAPVPDGVAMDSRHRHQLFMAFKEGLTNVVRHSGAKEVRLSIGLEVGRLRLCISDDGCGLPADIHTEEMDGVKNMRARLEKLGGRFEIASEPGRGTTLSFFVPLS